MTGREQTIGALASELKIDQEYEDQGFEEVEEETEMIQSEAIEDHTVFSGVLQEEDEEITEREQTVGALAELKIDQEYGDQGYVEIEDGTEMIQSKAIGDQPVISETLQEEYEEMNEREQTVGALAELKIDQEYGDHGYEEIEDETEIINAEVIGEQPVISEILQEEDEEMTELEQTVGALAELKIDQEYGDKGYEESEDETEIINAEVIGDHPVILQEVSGGEEGKAKRKAWNNINRPYGIIKREVYSPTFYDLDIIEKIEYLTSLPKYLNNVLIEVKLPKRLYVGKLYSYQREEGTIHLLNLNRLIMNRLEIDDIISIKVVSL